MSDIAAWALRGLRGQQAANDEAGGDESNDPGNTVGSTTATSDEGPPLTAEQMREQRLQRMQALQQQQQAEAAASSNGSEPQPMDVDSEASPTKKSPPSRKAPAASRPKPAPTSTTTTTTADASSPVKEKKKRKQTSADDANRKLQRKKELLLRKCLQISLANSSTTSDSTLTVLDTGSTEITVQSMAEILALRLSLDAADLPSNLSTKPLLAYLAQAHRIASDELKTLQQVSSKAPEPEILELLQEMERQVVNYAATCLQEPDLFPMAQNATQQLAQCLANTLTADSVSITFGVNGPSSSFYYRLVEELITQDEAAVDRVAKEIVDYFTGQLSKVDSVLAESGPDGGALQIVSALVSLCTHKRVAQSVTQHASFLMPPPGSVQANERVNPPMTGNRLLQQFMQGLNPPYLRRSGPGLEKHTLLGLCLRVGIPKNNPAFSSTNILRQSLAAVEGATNQQRGQLRVYQTACNQLIMNLIKGGAVSRGRVMDWFRDALLVNVGAAATRPDPSKVSSQSLLLNLSVVLMKLCDPFMNVEAKHALIDTGFLSSPSAHGGVFITTGDWAVERLGESEDDENANESMDEYNPKNAFIPHVFFFTARSLHFGLASLLSQHDNLLRSIGHAHWVITSRGGDLMSDPHFGMYVARQRSQEVALYQDDMVEHSLRFCNLLAKVLYQAPPEQLKRIPEHFVNDICDILTSIAKRKPSLLRGLQFGDTFRMVVKLLSPTYASMVRNYNLRAMLGDTIYEVFLPTADGARNEVPESVYMDTSVGQSYLLADPSAQETLAPSLLLLYGEVEHTGYYDKMSHRAKISSIIEYLWASTEHRPAFRRITQNRESFIKFANGIMNETNTLIATVMQKLPEIREAQAKMKNHQEWGQLTEEQQKQITERLEDNEREVKHALPLCNKTLKMFGYLNTDTDIRSLFLLDELCPRLVQMLLHVLTKLVGSKGLELKVDNPEELEFKPKIMLQDLCRIFGLFASAENFSTECAKSGCDPSLLRSALKTVRRINLLAGDDLTAFESLPSLVEQALQNVARDEALLEDAPEEFKDEILDTLMQDPVELPSGHKVDRSTIAQHLLNDPTDPFNRNPLKLEDVKPLTDLKNRILAWIEEKRRGA